MKKCILILGMHRSGTSLMTGILNASGISVGKTLLEPKEENPKGFFELKKLYNINEEILKVAGTRWNMLKKPILSDKEKTFYKEKIKHIIKLEFDGEPLFILKDPRICLLLSLYLDVLRELSIKVYSILVERDYSEIAFSLSKRNQYSLFDGYALSKHYYHSAQQELTNDSFTKICFEDLIHSSQSTLDKVMDFGNIEKVKLNEKAIDFVDTGLYRSKVPLLKKMVIQIGGEIKYLYFKCKFGL
jgi:hypothetical protein